MALRKLEKEFTHYNGEIHEDCIAILKKFFPLSKAALTSEGTFDYDLLECDLHNGPAHIILVARLITEDNFFVEQIAAITTHLQLGTDNTVSTVMISDVVSETTAGNWASILESLPIVVDEMSFSPMQKQYMVWITVAVQWPCGSTMGQGIGAIPSLSPPGDWPHKISSSECLGEKRWIFGCGSPRPADFS